ncbi:MAG: PLP-dependent transferase [Candidatus Hydrogenedentes bacterium]|nr:PLP-dependent transferase [Candidatus Hydrogenedentota bacterium]
MRFKTLSIHAGQEPDATYGAVMTPIYQTSTFAFRGANDPPPFDYSRSGNPTRKALEDCIATLEGGKYGYVFGTGMAAETTFFAIYGAGDHIIVHDDLYGGTYRLLTKVIANKGVAIDFVNLRDLDALQRAIRPETKCIWLETPTNPLMNLLDLKAIADIAKPRGIVTACDNTFCSPYFQRPLEFGIDVVMHSTTKYLNGHSDVVGGALITNDDALGKQIYFLQNAMGTCAGPMDCFLVLRGIKTLALRMEEHNKNALEIARWLAAHPKVEVVLHPGLESHPQHALAKKQMKGYGGTFSFKVKGDRDEAFRLVSNTKLFTLAISLGGVESLIEHPWTMTHSSMPEDARASAGITQNLVRVSVGLEDVQDLIADFEQAFKQV